MENKTYTQEQVDDICSKIKAKAQEKFDSLVANEYISKSEFAKLQTENRKLQKAIIQPKLEQALMSAGLKKECVKDFLQLNSGLYDVKEEDIPYNIQKCREARPYMFNNNYNAETGNQTQPNGEPKGNDTIETGIGTVITRNN